LIIATRRSVLARTQAKIISEIIEKKYSIKCYELLIETEGDKRLDIPLETIGGKGLFVKDIEYAILDKKAEIAVHSMKDVPYEIDERFEIIAMPPREDPRDVFISRNGLKFSELPSGAKVGTGSKRRAGQIKMLRDDIELVPIRGNVQTRIRKIKEENLDGIILAAAGLKRLGLASDITNYFTIEEMVPAIGQGALGIEILKRNVNVKNLIDLDDRETRICVEAERSFMRTLKGGCHTCIGAYAKIQDDLIVMTGIFPINDKIIKKSITGDIKDPIKLGRDLAEKILEG
jgi:hydroxymethylbilane synthase